MSHPDQRLADTTRHVFNPAVMVDAPWPDALDTVLSRAEAAAARGEISAWPGYAPTPLVALPGLAARCGVASIHYKDEGGRFGLGSFKALGGAYAVLQVVRRHLSERGIPHDTASILAGTHRRETADLTVTCATDGNHGRSVAWGAKLFGCRCVIYVHQTVSQGRVDAVARYGAEVIRHEGNYDETVHRAAVDAAASGAIVVSDTSYDGYVTIPRDVMHGYTFMAEEALDALATAGAPTHLVVPGGVGGVAAAVCAAGWWRYGAERPATVVVEPTRAACLLESAASGERALLHGDIETVMAGLSCGEPSLLAWQLLSAGAEHFVAVSDEEAVAAMRTLADGIDGDTPIVSGESAASVVAALELAVGDDALRTALGLDGASRVLLFGTEGDTDPELYRELVGRTADEVRGA